MTSPFLLRGNAADVKGSNRRQVECKLIRSLLAQVEHFAVTSRQRIGEEAAGRGRFSVFEDLHFDADCQLMEGWGMLVKAMILCTSPAFSLLQIRSCRTPLSILLLLQHLKDDPLQRNTS